MNKRDPVWRNLDRIRDVLRVGGVIRYRKWNATARLYDAADHRLCQVAWSSFTVLRNELDVTQVRAFDTSEYRLRATAAPPLPGGTR